MTSGFRFDNRAFTHAQCSDEKDVIYVPKTVLHALKNVQRELDEAQTYYESVSSSRPGFRRNPARWGAMGLMDRLVDEEHEPSQGTTDILPTLNLPPSTSWINMDCKNQDWKDASCFLRD